MTLRDYESACRRTRGRWEKARADKQEAVDHLLEAERLAMVHVFRHALAWYEGCIAPCDAIARIREALE